ncbi:MAG: PEGA domain-containing protein, partial [Deltaproteobacteria bacterium]|nr:PEGA domain-containing protein [Deltaproteobacteria bacterium]
ATAPPPTAPAVATAPPSDEPPPDKLPADEPPAAPAPAVAATTGDCKAVIHSSPSGSEIVIDGKTVGVTPATLALPCAATTILVRRTRYQPFTAKVTPTATGATVNARLERPTFTVKITSTPSGATVTIAGRRVGTTPLTTRAAGFEAVSATLDKAGYARTSAKIYAKANNTSVKVTLKKAGAKPAAKPTPAAKPATKPKPR